MTPTLPNGSSTTGGTSSPGVKIVFSASHRCTLRYTALVPDASTIAALLYSFPSCPSPQTPPAMVRSCAAASDRHWRSVAPDAAVDASDSASAASENTYPESDSSGSTTSRAPAIAAWPIAVLAASRLASSSPTASASCATATTVPVSGIPPYSHASSRRHGPNPRAPAGPSRQPVQAPRQRAGTPPGDALDLPGRHPPRPLRAQQAGEELLDGLPLLGH